jgi:hypothetical protein
LPGFQLLLDPRNAQLRTWLATAKDSSITSWH